MAESSPRDRDTGDSPVLWSGKAVATDGWQDPVLPWRGSFERTVELVEAAPAEAMNLPVPAHPCLAC